MNIVWKRPDGGISITSLTDEAISIDHEIEKLRSRGDIPVEWVECARQVEVPQDRCFRDAWTHDGTSFGVDITKAQNLTMDRLRVERSPLLADLDIQFMKAVETGDTKAQADIAKQKQVLRDCPNKVDNIQDLEVLKALKPV